MATSDSNSEIKIEPEVISSLIKIRQKYHKKACPIRVMEHNSPPSTSESANTFKCSHCSESFEYKSSLIIHEMSHKRKTTCQVCSKKIFKENFEEHLKLHLEIKSYFCDFCSLPFPTKFLLIYHLRTHVNSKAFYCNECGNGFNNKRHFKNHMQSHIDTRPFKCDSCPKDYRRKQHLEFHIIGAHQSERKLNCTNCDYSTTSIRDLKNHRQLTHVKKFKCNVCDREFKEKIFLWRHNQAVHLKSNVYKCLFCHQLFTTLNYVRRHLKIVHEDVGENYEYVDGKRDEFEEVMKNRKIEIKLRSQKVVNEEEIVGVKVGKISGFKGRKSDKAPPLDPSTSVKITSKTPSSQPQEVNTEKLFEIKLDHGKSTFIIPPEKSIADNAKTVKIFSVKTALEHLSNETKIKLDEPKNEVKEEERNIFKEEPQEFMDYQITPYIPEETPKISFSAHRARKPPASVVRTKNYPFGCSVCGLSFELKSTLLLHHMTHKNDNFTTYYCDLCPKTFKEKFSLEIHMNVRHRHVKIHKCHECDFSSSTYYALRTHKLKHIKLMKCEVCKKEFVTQRALADHHKLIHLSLKLYPCEVCGKLFKTMTYVKRHIKNTHAGEMKFGCSFCEKTFGTRGELNQHVGSLWKVGKCKTHMNSE